MVSQKKVFGPIVWKAAASEARWLTRYVIRQQIVSRGWHRQKCYLGVSVEHFLEGGQKTKKKLLHNRSSSSLDDK